MLCNAISVGGGHFTVCILEPNHKGSHKERVPWKPVNVTPGIPRV